MRRKKICTHLCRFLLLTLLIPLPVSADPGGRQQFRSEASIRIIYEIPETARTVTVPTGTGGGTRPGTGAGRENGARPVSESRPDGGTEKVRGPKDAVRRAAETISGKFSGTASRSRRGGGKKSAAGSPVQTGDLSSRIPLLVFCAAAGSLTGVLRYRYRKKKEDRMQRPPDPAASGPDPETKEQRK